MQENKINYLSVFGNFVLIICLLLVIFDKISISQSNKDIVLNTDKQNIIESINSNTGKLLNKNDNSNKELKILTNEDGYHFDGILKMFKKETGVEPKMAFTEDSLLSRLSSREEGDIIFNKISSELVEAKLGNLLGKLEGVDTSNIASEFKDKDNTWVNLSYRIRAFYVKKGLKDFPQTYEELADSKYKGKICIRPLSHTYNLQLIAYMISKHGEEYTKQWLKGLNNNLAIQPSGNDRAQVGNIFNGKCDIAIANSYYMGLMLSDNEQRAWAENIDLFFPNQKDKGSLALYNGVSLTKIGENNQKAKDLINYMLSPLGQQYLSASNYEYPVSGEAESEMIKSFGKFQNLEPKDIKIDKEITQETIANNRQNALLLVNELINK